MYKFEYLFKPFRLGDVDLKNRIVFQPHYTALNYKNGMPSDQEAFYYEERAKGGAGLLILYSVGCTLNGTMASCNIHGWNPNIIPGLKKYSELAHKYDCKIFGQISHSGHDTLAIPPKILLAPTQMPEPSSQFNTKEMEEEDIIEVIEGFAKTAYNYKQSGFDGIEIKVAHDGLLRSFVSEYFNRRKDKYGGTFENRMRFPLEVIKAIREAIGTKYPLGIRLCLDEFTSWGYGLDYGIKLAKAFEKTGMVTYINSDAGTFSSFFMEIPPSTIPAGFATYMSAALRNSVDLPIIGFGRINDPVQAEIILSEGSADLIGMARQLIADPEMPIKAKNKRTEDIRHCIGCNDGCIFQVMQNEPIRCIQNPAAGREKKFGIGTLKKAKIKKRIVVVGGGPAGMKTSEVAASRGHDVILLEKANELGGQLLIASKYPYREELLEIKSYLYRRLKRNNVKIILNHDANIENILKFNPDKIVIATGSYTNDLNIKGANQDNVYSVYDILENEKEIGQDVMIIDKNGHWKAAGMVEFLAEKNKNVSVVTPLLYFGQNLEPSNRELLYLRISEMNVKVTPSYETISINKKRAKLKNVYSNKTIEMGDFDSFIYVTTNYSNDILYRKLKNRFKELYRVGDCVAPRMIEQAIFDGEEVGRNL